MKKGTIQKIEKELDEKRKMPKELKEKYVKTYFAKYNAVFYKQLKEKYNASDRTDIADLYLLLIYGFNRMLRFNQKGEFNLPVGNVDFNQNAVDALTNYVSLTNSKKIQWSNEDYKTFLSKISLSLFKSPLVKMASPKWYSVPGSMELMFEQGFRPVFGNAYQLKLRNMEFGHLAEASDTNLTSSSSFSTGMEAE